MNADLHTLTGAYVLDALSIEERAAFEKHLAQCGSCASEVTELRETAAHLGFTVAKPPPAGLKPQVLEAIRTVRQLPPEEAAVVPLKRRKWPLRVSTAAAAVALIAAAGLGTEAALTNQELGQVEQEYAALSEVLTASDAQTATVESPGGDMTVVSSQSQDKLAVLPQGMSPAPNEHAYQLWHMDDAGARSAGLLTDADTPLVTEADAYSSQLAVTVEPEGGSEAPTSEPIMTVSLPQ